MCIRDRDFLVQTVVQDRFFECLLDRHQAERFDECLLAFGQRLLDRISQIEIVYGALDRLVAACGEPEYGGDESGRVAVAALKRFLRYDVIACLLYTSRCV